MRCWHATEKREMSIELVVMPVHGMGATPPDYDRKLKQAIRRRLGARDWAAVAWHPVYYQGVLQKNQERLLRDMRSQVRLDWIRLRRFLLFGFSDAAGMETKPQLPGSVYEKIQETILATLDQAFASAGGRNVPLVLVAHSLGCQVMSNYLWDAQQDAASAGVFGTDYEPRVGKRSRLDRFRRLKTLRLLFTTGCNIPIFIAGLPKQAIEPVIRDRRGWEFRWENYYDRDDVLGWPLRPINAAYRRTVALDRAINAGGTLTGWLGSWTPASHTAYWQDDDFLDPLEQGLRELLREGRS